MNPLLVNIGKFIGQRFLHFLLYLLLGLITIGIPYQLFFRDTSKTIVLSGGKIINGGDGLTPTIGCATGRQFIGWAHLRGK